MCEYKEQDIFVEHEREERLFKMSQMDDAKLRELAHKEMDKIRALSPGIHFFDL
jgi:DNA-binding transcriptional regulator YiaG